jgi:hypothetical protein
VSIELHCPNCRQLIRAPDDAGGKHGRCPNCKSTVYIPTPVAEDDVIPLAPIDEDSERHAEELWEESVGYLASVDKDAVKSIDDEIGRRAAGGAEPAGEVLDLSAMVTRFVIAMKESNLDEAEKVATRLKRAGVRARDHVESMFLDQMPPKIKDVPPPLVKGFLKTLLDRLS